MMFNRRWKRLSIFLTLTLVITLVIGCGTLKSGGAGSSTSEKQVVIGGVLSQTGPNNSFGIPQNEGIKMAVDEINEKGGFKVGGDTIKFKYVVEDAQSKPDIGASAAQKLLSSDNAKIILGGEVSAMAGPLIEIMKKTDAIFASGATSMDNFVAGNPMFFRTLVADQPMAQAYVSAALNQFEIKRVGALFPNIDLSKQTVETYKKEFKAKGVVLDDAEFFQSGTTDFAPILRKFKDKGLDAIIMGFSDTEGEAIVRQSLEVGGLPTVFLFRGGSSAPGLKYKDSIKGLSWIIATRDLDSPTDPDVVNWIKRYKERFKKEVSPTTYNALYYYDFVSMLAKAMQEAGTVSDMKTIASKLRGMSYNGVEDIKFNQDGSINFEFDLGILKGGKISTVPAKK